MSDTTSASKPHVYIEAGIALALKKPFIFCHYRREVWPADFAGVRQTSFGSRPRSDRV